MNIVYCIYNQNNYYLNALLPSMLSIVNNTKNNICFYIIHDDTLSIIQQKQIYDNIRKYNCSILFKHIKLNYLKIMDKVKYYTIGSLYSLFIQDLISEDFCLYIDCDTICNLDISILNEQDLDDKYILVTQGQTKNIHTGLIYYNLKLLRTCKENIFKKYYKLLNPKNILYQTDGYIINFIFSLQQYEKMYTYMDICFFELYDEKLLLEDYSFFNNKILHYVYMYDWHIKPWLIDWTQPNISPFYLLYKKYQEMIEVCYEDI